MPRFKLPYGMYQFMGIATLFGIGYIIVIGVFGRMDISPYLPRELAASIQNTWPQLPFFDVQRRPLADGQGEVIYYTVPTRQLTPQEIARISQGKPRPGEATKPPPAKDGAGR
jgi:hypothetical protein